MNKIIPFSVGVAALCGCGGSAAVQAEVVPLFAERNVAASENESVNRFPDRLDVLECCIDAVEAFGDPFAEKRRSEAMAYYRVGAQYLGGATGEGGRMHVAVLSYIRSAPRDSLLWGRRHSFVVFLDANFAVREFWRFCADTARLAIVDNRLCWNGGTVFDFREVPECDSVLVDGDLYPVPQ